MHGLPLFPDGRTAAVSMTYDDALNEHIDHAAVDLEAAGLRGTFYTPTAKGVAWDSRLKDWAALAQRGHELGNHTRFHPCSISHNWIKPNFSLEAYNETRMEQELLDASKELAAVDGKTVRSFAYTCCEDFIGPDRQTFRPMVERLFPGARGGGGDEPVADPWTVPLNFVPSLAVVESHTLADLKAFVDCAIEIGGWAVFQFHGVGGGHRMNVSRANHKALCEYIAARSKEICCDTFLNVAQAVRRATNRPWESRS